MFLSLCGKDHEMSLLWNNLLLDPMLASFIFMEVSFSNHTTIIGALTSSAQYCRSEPFIVYTIIGTLQVILQYCGSEQFPVYKKPNKFRNPHFNVIADTNINFIEFSYILVGSFFGSLL